MRCIGSHSDSQQLDTFIAFLVTRQIGAHVDREANPPLIWIKNEDQVAEATKLYAQFVANPTDPIYTDAVGQASEMLRSEARKRAEARKLIRNHASEMRFSRNYRAPLTVFLTVACVVSWVFQTFTLGPNTRRAGGSNPVFYTMLYRAFAFTAIPPNTMDKLGELSVDDPRLRLHNLRRGELWRLVTPIFIHFGAAHIILNLLSFFQLGRVLEDRHGPLKLAAIIVLIAAVSNLVQCVVPVLWGGAPVARLNDGWGLSGLGGISGVVFGLLGYAWISSRLDWRAGYFVPRSAMIGALVWLAIGFAGLDQRLFGFHMGNWAHGVGFVMGIALGYLMTRGQSPLAPQKPKTPGKP
jgi:GlpG protein